MIVIGVGFYVVGRKIETDSQPEEIAGNYAEHGLLERREYGGQTYVQRANQTSILVMGVDRTNSTPEQRGYRAGGQSDFIMLLVLDHDTKTIRRLQIERDTMTDVLVMSVLGKPVGTKFMQICLAHAYGANQAENGENTMKTVENLLEGIDIELYLSMNIAGLPALNEALGGVTVTIPEDMTYYDPQMQKGATLTLTGKQTEILTRYRYNVADESNEQRMVRQRAFMEAAIRTFTERVREDNNFVGKLYDALGDNMTTNMYKGRMINEANRAYSYTVAPIEYLKGSYKIGDDGFMEFHPDEQFIIDWVLDVFYKPISQ